MVMNTANPEFQLGEADATGTSTVSIINALISIAFLI
jgi:hypothetical protein